MDINDPIETDKSFAAQWAGSDIHSLPGVELSVIPSTHPNVERVSEREQRKALLEAAAGKEINEETIAAVMEKIDMDRAEDQALITAALKGWRGLTSGGAPYEYSPKAAVDLCRGSAPFLRAVIVSVRHVTYRANLVVGGLAKNSQTPSGSKSRAASRQSSREAGSGTTTSGD